MYYGCQSYVYEHFMGRIVAQSFRGMGGDIYKVRYADKCKVNQWIIINSYYNL